jgi:DNA-binding SARP family transcriptional activator
VPRTRKSAASREPDRAVVSEGLPATDLAGLPIHYRRLATRIAESGAPLVWLAGWPGSGRRKLLEGLRQQLNATAAALPPGLAEDTGALRATLGGLRAAGARWFLADDWPAAALEDALSWLEPHETLIASSGAHWDRLEPAARARACTIGPLEMLLTVAEVGEALSRRGIEPHLAEGWHRLSDGWKVPLELALSSPSLGAAKAATGQLEQQLATYEPLRTFVRDRVLAGLGPESIAALRRLGRHSLEGVADATGGTSVRAGVSSSAWRELVERRELLVPFPDAFRMPRPLALYLSEGSSRRTTSVAAKGGAVGRVVIRLLGPPRIELVDDEGEAREVSWPFRRVLHFLSLLALTPDGCTQERVLEALWPETGLTAARASLHPTVSHLRRLLARSRGAENPIVLRSGVYRLNPAWTWSIDALRFEELAIAGSGDQRSKGRLVQLEEAWRLYRGPLLEGVTEAWTAEPRRRLDQRHRQVLAELAELYAGLERLEEAEDCLRTLLASDPLREDVHLRLMLLHARRGRTDLVRRQYERLCGLLARELGAQPLDATVRAVERLLG